MPDVFKPLDGDPWPAATFLRQSPTWAPSGVIGSPAAAYGSGDMALSFAVAGSVITVQMAVGRAICRGGFYERTTSQWVSGAAGTQPTPGTAAYTLNSNSNPRIDRLVLRRDAAAQKVYPFIIQGTPAATPTKPALTQVETGTWDAPLFSWQLAGSNSTSISNIVDERFWVSPDGGRAAPVAVSFAAAFTANSLTSLNVVRDNRGAVTVEGLFTSPATVNNVSGTWFTLPAGYRPSSVRIGQAYIEGGLTAAYAINPDGTVVGLGMVVGSVPITGARYWAFEHMFLAAGFTS